MAASAWARSTTTFSAPLGRPGAWAAHALRWRSATGTGAPAQPGSRAGRLQPRYAAQRCVVPVTAQLSPRLDQRHERGAGLRISAGTEAPAADGRDQLRARTDYRCARQHRGIRSLAALLGLQWLLFHQRNLLAQFQYPVLPVALRIEPGEGRGKGRIVPAARDPRRVVD